MGKVDDYENSDLSAQQQAALRLADVYLGAPAGMTDALKQELAAQLTPEQTVEIALKLMGFSSDKVMVALGLDLDEVKIFTM